MNHGRYSKLDLRSTSVTSEQMYTDEETYILREIHKRTREQRRSGLTNIEVFRIIKELGYKKDNDNGTN